MIFFFFEHGGFHATSLMTFYFCKFCLAVQYFQGTWSLAGDEFVQFTKYPPVFPTIKLNVGGYDNEDENACGIGRIIIDVGSDCILGFNGIIPYVPLLPCIVELHALPQGKYMLPAIVISYFCV